jgi:dihydroflavonol-4-reductase
MRIGILGATGMLGRHVAEAALAEGHQLVVLHRPRARLDRLHGLAWQGRIADLDQQGGLAHALRGLDAVVNAAAYYPVVPRPLAAEMATALGQLDAFLDACAQAAVPRILYVGGAIALPRHPQGEPGDESLVYDAAPEDRTPYVQVKWAMDARCRERAARGEPIVIGIPSMTLGEYDYGPTTGRLVLEIAKRRLAAYVAGERNVVWAGDAGRGLLLAALHGRRGERYLITGENATLDALVAQVVALTAAPMPRAVPLGVARAVAKAQEIRWHLFGGAPPRFSATAIAVMASGQFLSGAKAAQELGYLPSTGMAGAVTRALNWFRREGMLQPIDAA